MEEQEGIPRLYNSFEISTQPIIYSEHRYLIGWGEYKGKNPTIRKLLNYVEIKLLATDRSCAISAMPIVLDHKNMICTRKAITREKEHHYETVSIIFSNSLKIRTYLMNLNQSSFY